MSPRLVGDYPEKFTLRVSEEQRINFIALAWFKGMDGKYGVSVRWFFEEYFPRMYASWSDEERAKFEEHKELVILNEGYANPLLPKKMMGEGEIDEHESR